MAKFLVFLMARHQLHKHILMRAMTKIRAISHVITLLPDFCRKNSSSEGALWTSPTLAHGSSPQDVYISLLSYETYIKPMLLWLLHDQKENLVNANPFLREYFPRSCSWFYGHSNPNFLPLADIISV